ncbi:adenylosuccinate synthase [Gudongella sp. SC589]|jgi:adenylosuccinate synthase|uniref:adenylosuccinate synthase n=1 Tax=Gudongella sp. SC589 TaxID=3385990 RepID=UPI003904C5D5
MKTAIVGINWGDEGKGRMVDLLSQDQDIVVRYQGGNNAGHTVVNEKGKFIFNLMPSGILREDIVNIMGNGMVIDIEHLCGELDSLQEKGISVTEKNLLISDKAVICMPYHVLLDQYEEERLKDKKYGSTKRGIAPVYADKYRKKGIRMGELFFEDSLKARVQDVVEYENLLIEKGYGKVRIDWQEMYSWLLRYGERLKPYIADVGAFLTEAVRDDMDIMFEAQLGALRDIDYGIYPYTTSSSTIAAYAPIGAGIPGEKMDRTVGVVKAYSSCVGEGPFTAEMEGEEADKLREAGAEYGAATGRPRRVGAFDVVATKYGCLVQGADEIALTKLDVLSYMESIPVCTAYKIDGEKTTDFPVGPRLDRAEPVIEYMFGWNKDITKCRTLDELPSAAKAYISYIQRAISTKITYVSVGPGRDEYIKID